MSVWPLPRISFRALSSIDEKRPVALLTSNEVWAGLSAELTLPVLIQAEPAQYGRDLFDSLASNLPSQVQAVYAVGGGAPVEAAKVIAGRNNIPLVIVPTALDSAAMLRPTALVREQVGDSKRLIDEATGPATEIIIDWSVIQSAPAHLRGGAMVDVLSIVTGLLDWRYAAQKGKNPREQRFVPWAAGVVAGLVKEAFKEAAGVGQGDQEALETLLNLLMTTVQIGNQLGHTRAQQGSEHYLARILAGTTNFRVPHPALAGPCLIFAAALHGQDPAPLREALESAGIPLDQLRATDLSLVIDNLPTYLGLYELPYSILNDIVPDSVDVLKALDTAGLAIQIETWEKPDDTQPAAEAGSSIPEEAPLEQKDAPGGSPVEDATRPAEDPATPASEPQSPM